jgi:hypothetical protein
MQEHQHAEGHQCDLCSGKIKDLPAWEREQMKKSGFYAHMVQEEDGYLNAHTHGFEETWGHTDVQVVLPIPGKTIMHIFWTLADWIKEGRKFEADKQYEQVIQGLPVKILWARDGDRPVLRIILPDSQARMPGDYGCDPAFEAQLTVTGGVQEGEKT